MSTGHSFMARPGSRPSWITKTRPAIRRVFIFA